MRTFTVADAKAKLSAVLAEVEGGTEVLITRRGRAVARIVPEPSSAPNEFDMEDLFAFVDGQRMHKGPDAGKLLRQIRNETRY